MTKEKQDMGDVIFVGKGALDEAVDLLFRYDPEEHHPEDYVLSIASAILGSRRFDRDGNSAYILHASSRSKAV